MTPDCHFMLSALALEQWLRFAWLDDQERLALPDDARTATASSFPELAPLLNRLLALEDPADGDAARVAILAEAEARLGHTALGGRAGRAGISGRCAPLFWLGPGRSPKRPPAILPVLQTGGQHSFRPLSRKYADARPGARRTVPA